MLVVYLHTVIVNVSIIDSNPRFSDYCWASVQADSLLALMASVLAWVFASTCALTNALAAALSSNWASCSLAAARAALLAAALLLPLTLVATLDLTDAIQSELSTWLKNVIMVYVVCAKRSKRETQNSENVHCYRKNQTASQFRFPVHLTPNAVLGLMVLPASVKLSMIMAKTPMKSKRVALCILFIGS